jgi:hypothetical protein
MSDEIRKLGPGEIHFAPPMPPIPPWAGPQADVMGDLRALLAKPLITDEQSRLLRQLFEDFGRAASEAVAGLRPVMESLREAGVIPEEPPKDPKTRALWLRQHRNTGPRRPGPQDSPRHRRRDR